MKIILFYLMLLLVGSVSMDQSAELKDHGSSSGEIYEVLKELTASLTELKCDVNTLKKENADQETKLEVEIKKLKEQQQITQVAFSASLSQSSVTLGPFDIATTLAFKIVETNIGNAYNKETGIFTAPVRGAYHFDLHVGVFGSSVGAVIMKNGERTFVAYESQSNGFASSSSSITLRLEVGDQVSVSLWPGNKLFDDDFKHSTFSGHLLFTM